MNAQWVCDTPVLSAVEAKLRQLLIDLGNDDKILGIQVDFTLFTFMLLFFIPSNIQSFVLFFG